MIMTKIVRGSMVLTITLSMLCAAMNPENRIFAQESPENSYQAGFDLNQMGKGNEDSWIIKWKNETDAAFYLNSDVISEDVTYRTSVARPAAGIDKEKWVEFWAASPLVNYIQENQPVVISAKSNDPLVGKQNYLQQIHAEEAWDEVKESQRITIALVDTGVDLQHPDLKDNLVKGVNLIDQHKLPQDDNGHGTNVAGVIAAMGNNNKGVTGLVWRTKIMPVKALEANGRGDEDKLGEGIRYAVDHGADIIVLSVGLYRSSPFMKEIVDYAEDKGVLLISASGNDGKAVKYPAGYPTVLAVGGATPKNKVDTHSNFGPEIDVVAPWSVYTTALRGGYASNEGTSMAAPQVAGAAALILAKYPHMKPYQVRNLIRQTADDLEAKGWDPYTGYGLLRVDKALKEPYHEDIYENNDRKESAKPLPVDSMAAADFNGGTDQDWFIIDAPYEGDINFRLTSNDEFKEEMKLTYFPGNQPNGKVYSSLKPSGVQIKVPKGKSYIKLNLANTKLTKAYKYKIVTKFTMNADDFENNDTQYKAFALTAKSQALQGNFHQNNDQDWFKLDVKVPGTLRLALTTNTMRMDLAMSTMRKGEQPQLIDLGGEGDAEYSPLFDLKPGQYYIQVFNAVADNASPVTGEYKLNLDYTPRYADPNEPNNKSFQANSMVLGTVYKGVFDKVEDVDWFSFKLDSKSLVNINMSNIPVDRITSLALNSNSQIRMLLITNAVGETKLSAEKALDKGTYYIKLSVNQAFQHQQYNLKVSSRKLISGYVDITNHWAKGAITDLTTRKIVSGYGNYLFKPNLKVTRAEAVVMFVKAFKFTKESGVSFSDVTTKHWAHDFINKATTAKIISGYKDGTFKPNQPITRAEMAALLLNALGIQRSKRVAAFTDVPRDYWAAPIISRLKAEGKISGYADGSFRPNGLATRAEIAEIISKSL